MIYIILYFIIGILSAAVAMMNENNILEVENHPILGYIFLFFSITFLWPLVWTIEIIDLIKLFKKIINGKKN